MNFKKEKRVALLAAKQAGKILLHYYGKKEIIKEKPNKSLVAKADIEANKVIIKSIKKSFPTHSILSEETGFEDNKSDYKWVIDPLDGTHNFLHGIPIFGTSIALEYKNEVMLGVLHFPTLKMTAVAEKGKGAFLNGKRLKVSGKKELNYAFIALEFTSRIKKKVISFLDELAHENIDVRDFGSAVYGLLMVASGKCDAFVAFLTNEWDIAAGALIILEAGGKITDSNGNKWVPSKNNIIISNGKLHNKLLNYAK